MKIKELTKNLQPRERLQEHGVQALNDAELLAIVLRSGCKGENIVEVCNRLLSKYGLEKLPDLSLVELQTINGIGPAKAMQVLALLEFSKRQTRARNKNIRVIQTSEDVFKIFSTELRDKTKEHLYVLMLDSKNNILRQTLISVGTLNESVVHVREVFRDAIKENACSIVLVHNHPSGDPEPSEEDREVTERIKAAGRLVGIELIDHVIIGKDAYRTISC